jgi:hypothetical protein
LGPEILEFEKKEKKVLDLKFKSIIFLKIRLKPPHLKNFQIDFKMSKPGPNVMMKWKNCTTLKRTDKKIVGF